MNKRTLGIITIIIIVAVVYYIYIDTQTVDNESNLELSAVDVSIEGGGDDYFIEIVPIGKESNTPIPDLDREIVLGADILPETQDKLVQRIQEIILELKKDSSFFDNWISLGLYRKNIGDNNGAREAWEYATILSPSSSLPYHNLGDLYAYYLNDTQKAEENFLKAIENGPNEIYLYFKTSDFYKYVMKDDKKARAIVKKGLDANPDSEDLQKLLNSL